MKLTKEDFMKLRKERLAELLVEAQDQVRIETIQVPSIQTEPFIKPWDVTWQTLSSETNN